MKTCFVIVLLCVSFVYCQLSEKPLENAHELAEEERQRTVEEKHWKAYRDALAAEQRTKDELVKILSNANMDAEAKQLAYHKAAEDSRKFAEEAKKYRAQAEEVHRREKRLREMHEKIEASNKKEQAFSDTDLTLEDRVVYDAEVAEETEKRRRMAEKQAKVVTAGDEPTKPEKENDDEL